VVSSGTLDIGSSGVLVPSATSTIQVAGVTTLQLERLVLRDGIHAQPGWESGDIYGCIDCATAAVLLPLLEPLEYARHLYHFSGLVTFDRAGTTTLGNASAGFYKVAISSGATLDTSAADDFALSTSNAMTITGTLTCNESTCSFTGAGTSANYSLQTAAGSTFTGGTGHIQLVQ